MPQVNELSWMSLSLKIIILMIILTITLNFVSSLSLIMLANSSYTRLFYFTF